MPPALNLPVPSPSLLRFLRAQSQGLSFDAGHGILQPSGYALPQRACRSITTPPKRPSRALCTSTQRKNTVMQAGFWDLDAMLQRSFRKRRSQVDATEASRLADTHRYASSNPMPRAICRPSWREIIWARATGRGITPLKPEDLPLRDDRGGPGSIFSPSRTQAAAKAALEPRLRCTEVDENGDVILADGEFKKSELIAKVCEMVKGRITFKQDSPVLTNHNSMVSSPGISARLMLRIFRTSSSDLRLFYSISSI